MNQTALKYIFMPFKPLTEWKSGDSTTQWIHKDNYHNHIIFLFQINFVP